MKRNTKKMKHLLDYEILQNWGFVWAEYEGDDKTVRSYVIPKTLGTDAFNFEGIFILSYFSLSFGWMWQITTGNEACVLFRGRITSSRNLEHILKSCVVFKFDKNNRAI